MQLTKAEKTLGRMAAEVVTQAGGTISFTQYDKLMYPKLYFAPIHWINGWGNSVLHKQNNDKLCAFAAVELKLLEQTSTGYKVITNVPPTL